MDAPKGRYSVVEKDGGLVVIDNRTGAPIPSSVAPPPARSGQARFAAAGPVNAAGPGAIDRAAGLLLAAAARQRDSQGRAIVAWEWRQNGQVRRWDAALDEGQQRRLGRALLALSTAPLLLVAIGVADGALLGLGMLLVLPWLAWGAVSIRRLYRETNDPGRA
jgi:hypothetical protein